MIGNSAGRSRRREMSGPPSGATPVTGNPCAIFFPLAFAEALRTSRAINPRG